jgi:uncharacterized protein YndB with AHSA1/START domain
MAKENDPAIAMKDIFVTRRSFDASRELLFAAFTDPEHLMRWWAPKGFKMVYCKLDLRPHGMMHYCAQAPDGKAVWGQFAYSKIQMGQRIIFTNTFLENTFPGWSRESPHNIVFIEEQGRTTILLTSKTAINIFDQLEDYVAGNIIINKIA